MAEQIETVVIGGGQAGLALSYCLGQLGHEHVVLERGRLAERWRSERWDSLTLLSPNWMTQLPGYGYTGDDPDGFAGRDAVVQFLEDYAASFQPPLRCGVNVTSVQPQSGTLRYRVETTDETIAARNVVVATGAFQHPRIPALSGALPAGILQLHTRDYRNPAQLPPGAIIVVGTGASGCQVADDLRTHGRTVYLSVGRCQRWPRRYRGRDIYSWFNAMGILDEAGRRHILDPIYGSIYGCTAVLTGVRGGYDLDYDRFSVSGMTLLGHVEGVQNGMLGFVDDLNESLALWDESHEVLTRMIDAYIEQEGLTAQAQNGQATAASRAWRGRAPILELDVKARGISTVIWATGFRADYSWLDALVLDTDGEPIQHRGVTSSPGLYFLGLRRMYEIKSSFLFGVGEDAVYLAEHIAANP